MGRQEKSVCSHLYLTLRYISRSLRSSPNMKFFSQSPPRLLSRRSMKRALRGLLPKSAMVLVGSLMLLSVTSAMKASDDEQDSLSTSSIDSSILQALLDNSVQVLSRKATKNPNVLPEDVAREVINALGNILSPL